MQITVSVRVCAPGVGEPQVETRTFEALASGLNEMVAWLRERCVDAAVMEGTGIYWLAPFEVLEAAGIAVTLVNARQVKQLKGRKTDVADSVWLARVCQFGLATASHVPPKAFREMRVLTRYRRTLIGQRSRVRNRVQKVLDRSGVRVGGVLCDVFGRNGRRILDGLAKGLDHGAILASLSQLQQAGMKTAVMDEIMRQRDPELKVAVEASLAGDVARAFEKLGSNVAEVKPDNLAGAAAARWLALSPEERANAGLMAPSHALREDINAIVRERLVRDGAVHGPALEGERLVSKGYTSAEKTLPANYAAGDVVAFHRPYKRLGVAKGDELRVAGVDHGTRTVTLEAADGRSVAWEPNRFAARAGGVEVYRAEAMELRAGDRIRWTRNDTGLGLVNSQTAEVAAVRDGRVTFRLEDGRMLDLSPGDPQLRHIDRGWASTVHAFQGRTVDTVIAPMEANHPNLTNQKTLYVEISRARDRAELVTDDRAALKERLEAVIGERIAALEAVEPERAKSLEPGLGGDRSAGQEDSRPASRETERAPELNRIDRDMTL